MIYVRLGQLVACGQALSATSQPPEIARSSSHSSAAKQGRPGANSLGNMMQQDLFAGRKTFWVYDALYRHLGDYLAVDEQDARRQCRDDHPDESILRVKEAK